MDRMKQTKNEFRILIRKCSIKVDFEYIIKEDRRIDDEKIDERYEHVSVIATGKNLRT